MSSVDGRYRVVWPRGARQISIEQLAERSGSLEGLKIAHLWDYLFRGDEVFDALEEGIRKVVPNVSFVSWREFGSTHGQGEREILAALPRRFKELGVGAAISGMGC